MNSLRSNVDLTDRAVAEGTEDPLTGSARLIIVAGKGGVGKTTVAAALAHRAAGQGRRVLVADIEGRHGIAEAFGHSSLGYAAVTLAPGISGRCLRPDDALVEYLTDHGLGRFSRRLASSGVLEVVATATPGIKDLLVLGKAKQLALGPEHDLVIVDTPASGHARTFLQSAQGLLDAVQSGPVRRQAEDVRTLLCDSQRCRVLLVTLAEETPVNETAETAAHLRRTLGIALGPIIVNQVEREVDLPHPRDLRALVATAHVGWTEAEIDTLSRAATFLGDRQIHQRSQVERLASLIDLPQIQLPRLAAARIGPADVARLAEALDAGARALPM